VPGTPREPHEPTDLIHKVEDLHSSFIAAGIDPSSWESREQWGREHHWLRDYIIRSEHRRAKLDRFTSALATAIVTTLLTSAAGLVVAWLLSKHP
jgi:hypothetical protein